MDERIEKRLALEIKNEVAEEAKALEKSHKEHMETVLKLNREFMIDRRLTEVGKEIAEMAARNME